MKAKLMGNIKRMSKLQAIVLASVCAARLLAPTLASAQAVPVPAAPPPAGTPGVPPVTPEPPVAEPALPTYPASATPPEQAVGPDGQPLPPVAAEPTAPPGYVESISPQPDANIEAAPTIDEQLVTEPKSKLPSYIMWGVGGASLIAGAVLGITAITAKSDFNDNPTYAAADRVEGRAIAADVALGAGVVLLLTGTVFYFVPDSQESRPATASNNSQRPTARLSVTPLLGRTNGGALTLKF